MENVLIQIPGHIYAEIYAQHGDRTSQTIATWLSEKLREENAESITGGSSGSLRYPRPSQGTKTGRVWEIADELLARDGKAPREAVIRACMDEGLNVNTASTQYSYWKASQA